MNSMLLKIFYLLILYLINLNNLKSENNTRIFYKEESSGKVTIDGFNLPSGATYNLFKGTYQFKNELGNYGVVECKGLVDKNINNFSLNILCEQIDKNNFKIYSLLKRKGNDMSAGVGKSVVIEATGYNKLLVGTECTYASLYVGKTSWTDFKCYIDKAKLEAYKKALEKYN